MESFKQTESTEWDLLMTGASSGAFNMALDYRLAHEWKKPLLRFYGWEPHTISVGFHQTVESMDTMKCEVEGIGLVRRPTGGRSIFHSEEITYSAVIPDTASGVRKSVQEIYALIHTAIAAGLRRLGIDAALVPTGDKRLGPVSDALRSPCFAASARSEVQVEGRKLVGSAGRRFGGSVLLHGSLLVGRGHLRLPEFLDCKPEDRESVRRSLERSTITLADVLGHVVNPNKLIEPLIEGFKESLGVRFRRIALPSSLAIDVERLTGEFDLLPRTEREAVA